jgi:spore germination cell wall hydrolase CwlJ-like protein
MLTEAMLCLALNIFYEAGAEPLEGKIGVANVTMNRVTHEKYPDSICEVVYQPYQFSWTNNPKAKPSGKNWDMSKNIARLYLTVGGFPDITNGATHYHNNTVKPKWSYKMKKLTKIGRHTYYKKSFKAS